MDATASNVPVTLPGSA